MVVIAWFVVRYWRRNYDNGKAIPYILIFDTYALVGFFAWATVAKGSWPWLDFAITVGAWFAVGVESIIMTSLALLDNTGPGAPEQEERENAANFVPASLSWRSRLAVKRELRRLRRWAKE